MWYIECNDKLFHHGIKGQKWGVRRYQNKDGTLTAEGKRQNLYRRRVKNAIKTNKDVNSIVDTFNLREKQLILGGNVNKDDKYIDSLHELEYSASLAKRILLEDGDTPISFIDIWDDGDKFNVAIGTRKDNKYRGKGYAMKAASKGLEWYEKNKDKYDNMPIYWGVHETNKGSIAIAKKLGFKYEKGSKSKDGWVNYKKN